MTSTPETMVDGSDETPAGVTTTADVNGGIDHEAPQYDPVPYEDERPRPEPSRTNGSAAAGDALQPPPVWQRSASTRWPGRPGRRTSIQPYRELGLQEDEYARIRQILGRRPTESELGHVLDHVERALLVQVEQGPPETVRRQGAPLRPACWPGSARTPASSGSPTGSRSRSRWSRTTIRPLWSPTRARRPGSAASSATSSPWAPGRSAVMDPLRFGAADHEDTKRVLPGVVAGIGGYGNCLGLPNIGGELVFDECYQGNPLVNALCVGVLPVEPAAEQGGGRAGQRRRPHWSEDRPGRHRRRLRAGQRHLRRRERAAPSERAGRRPVHGEAAHRVVPGALRRRAGRRHPGPRRRRADLCADRDGGRRRHRHVGQPRPGAAARAVDARRTRCSPPSRRSGCCSSSPRRTCAVVLSICARWGVLATAIGEVVDPEASAGRLRIWWRGEVVVDVPPGSLADDGPVYARPMREPNDRMLMAVDRAETLPRPESGEELRADAAAHGRLAEPVRQDLGDRAVRPLRARQHRAGPARGRRRAAHRRGQRARASPSRWTATAASPGSTRTTARSSPWPRRTATSPSPVPCRSPSPTASTSARPRTRR